MREFKDLKIAVAGTGYVGLSIATLLSQHHMECGIIGTSQGEPRGSLILFIFSYPGK